MTQTEVQALINKTTHAGGYIRCVLWTQVRRSANGNSASFTARETFTLFDERAAVRVLTRYQTETAMKRKTVALCPIPEASTARARLIRRLYRSHWTEPTLAAQRAPVGVSNADATSRR